MNEYIKSDLYRYYGKTGFMRFLKLYLVNCGFRFQVAHRLVNSSGVEKVIGKILWIYYRHSKRFQIPKEVRIGYGLYIGYLGPVIMHPTVVIGDNCNISQYLTIGSNEGKAATIGSNVYIGPNVCIVENVRIGNSVTIGAGSVVVKNIPDNATAAGNYAKVINYHSPGRYINNKWKLSK